MIYTCHQYMDFLTSAPARYPDFDRNTLYNKAFISQQLDARDEFMRKHGVPCWMGEFGMLLNVEGYTEYRLRAFADMLDLLNERGCHFSIWSYKDIGLYGTVQLKPDAPWMLFIRDTLKIKQRYHLDTHVRADDDWGLGSILSLGDPDGFSDQTGRVKNAVTGAIKAVLSRELADRLAIRMARLSAKELSTLGQSFSYDYCFIDEKREDVINRHGFLK
jgi:hypothetical protein